MPRKPRISAQDIAQVVQEQGARVRALAARIARKLPLSVEREDLEQDGYLGLMEAMVRWTRETNGAHFENFIALRAQGAMLDGLRAIDPATRKVRSDMRRVELAIQRLGHRLGRAPGEGEVAAELGMPLKDYQRLLQEAQGYQLLSLEDLELDTDVQEYLYECARQHSDPLVVLERSVFRQTLALSLAELTDQEQEVLRLYYGEGYRMHEVGKAMGISESRVSQLHTKAIAELRAAMRSPDEQFTMLKPRRNQR
jgi:RNA polymerase sigma factor for flagellar operon FliA